MTITPEMRAEVAEREREITSLLMQAMELPRGAQPDVRFLCSELGSQWKLLRNVADYYHDKTHFVDDCHHIVDRKTYDYAHAEQNPNMADNLHQPRGISPISLATS